MTGKWQSMESAPRDGTAILIYGRCTPEEGSVYTGIAVAVWDGRWLTGDWRCIPDTYYGIIASPEKWQPLPPV